MVSSYCPLSIILYWNIIYIRPFECVALTRLEGKAVRAYRSMIISSKYLRAQGGRVWQDWTWWASELCSVSLQYCSHSAERARPRKGSDARTPCGRPDDLSVSSRIPDNGRYAKTVEQNKTTRTRDGSSLFSRAMKLIRFMLW